MKTDWVSTRNYQILKSERYALKKKNVFRMSLKFSEKYKSLFKTPSTVQGYDTTKVLILDDAEVNPNKNKKITKKNKKIRSQVFHRTC